MQGGIIPEYQQKAFYEQGGVVFRCGYAVDITETACQDYISKLNTIFKYLLVYRNSKFKSSHKNQPELIISFSKRTYYFDWDAIKHLKDFHFKIFTFACKKNKLKIE